MPPVSLTQVLRFRARAQRLDHRLAAGALPDAARGGLQDTVPRAALTALHARLEGVAPASWEDPSLWQIRFRHADYVVPRDDFGVFTIGRIPRNQEQTAALEAVALAICDTLAGEPMNHRKLLSLMPAVLRHRGITPPPLLLGAANVVGRYRIRWDASRVTVIPTERPKIDPGQARLELARRFLDWYGPATCAQFAKWAGISREDATQTWTELGPELMSVTMDGQVRELLLQDEESLLRAEPITGVRLLPLGDPYLSVDKALAEAAAADMPRPTTDDRGAVLTLRLINSLLHHILVDGRIVGRWGRYQHHMSIHLSQAHRHHQDRVLAEAESFSGPIGRPMHIRWLHSA